MNSPEKGSVLAEAESRSQRWWVALVVLVVGGVGFVLGLLLADSNAGQPPAIDIAREVGLALPIEQQSAFADGVITRPEVEDAIERLTACAEEGGVTGFVASLADEGTGFHLEHLGEMRNVVELCRLKHFEATYMVWAHQERVSN
jgi:hypothetical protein